MASLYPLKFKARPKETVWGGRQLAELFGKDFPADRKTGESWELSALQGNQSVVTNGFLKGNNIEEMVEIYMGELVGEKIYDRYGVEFPILVKLLDAQERLSVQVHPDDETARERHDAYGKTEMWYVVQAESGAVLYIGFNRTVTAAEFYTRTQNDTLPEILNSVEVQAGDAFFIPAGTVHAIGKGVVIAEIQQTSDITYRVYDWGREHRPETAREMHVEQAIDVIDYVQKDIRKTACGKTVNAPVVLAECPYFTTSFWHLTQPVVRNLLDNDTFVIYLCIDGAAELHYNGGKESIAKGETLLVPASLADYTIYPSPAAKLLETFM